MFRAQSVRKYPIKCPAGCHVYVLFVPFKLARDLFKFITFQVTNFKKKQCGGVYFCVYSIAFWLQNQQKFTPPDLLFRNF